MVSMVASLNWNMVMNFYAQQSMKNSDKNQDPNNTYKTLSYDKCMETALFKPQIFVTEEGSRPSDTKKAIADRWL